MKRHFFFGLNELRSIAALSVVVHHIELYKHRDGKWSLYDTRLQNIINSLGKQGVYLFFVLSGFLITYLLLVELKETDKISLTKFYMRRILRIWPLYYLLLIVSMFILPQIISIDNFFGNSYYVTSIKAVEANFNSKFLLFLLFLPNVALVLFRPVPGFAQSWSVGVEEQFYLFWPLLLAFFKKRILVVLVLISLFKPIVVAAMSVMDKHYHLNLTPVIQILADFKIELMAIGGIGAYFFFHRRKYFDKLLKPYTYFIALNCLRHFNYFNG